MDCVKRSEWRRLPKERTERFTPRYERSILRAEDQFVDLKPANILANRAGQVKLCDMSVSGTLVNSIAMSVVGTQCYMSVSFSPTQKASRNGVRSV